jgi:hypothetical protein
MKVDGACHCGSITFTAEIDPEKVRICHCTDCQNSTGAAYRVNVPAIKGTFRMTGGPAKQYVKTTAESGTKRVQGFCPQCGTPIYSSPDHTTEVVGLRVGAIRQRAELKPKLQQWCRSKLDWAQDLRALPQHTKQAG